MPSLLPIVLCLVVGAKSQTCETSLEKDSTAPSLLQAKKANVSKTSIADTVNASAVINPSGAAAPLNQDGYGAVADRCCQAEMREFIRRQSVNLGLEICESAGLLGITPYHSCGLGPRTFDVLTADLLADSAKRCTWIATAGNCKPPPDDCDQYADFPPVADCGCNRSNAAKVNLFTANIAANNLGGKGPITTDPPELRYTGGVAADGTKFDVVITSETYQDGRYNGKWNGKVGYFGRILMDIGLTTDFKFSFMSPGTNTPVTLKEIHLAMFDLDGFVPWGLEHASSKGYKGYVTDTDPDILASLKPDGRTEFRSDGTPNVASPSIPSALTLKQRRHSVMYFYTDVSSLELQWGSDGTEDGTRLLFFAFESALDDRCGE
jgi:hypothetical protein